MSSPCISVIEEGVRTLLSGLGEDITRDGLIDTPKRVAKAQLDAVAGYALSSESVIGSAVFQEPLVTKGSGGLVIVRSIDFACTCDATLMPFHGQCHIAYIPAQPCVLGLSKLARLVNAYSKRVMSQQAFTDALRRAVDRHMPCRGAAAIVHARGLADATRSCARTTYATSGCFAAARSQEMQEVVLLLRLGGVTGLTPPQAAAAADDEVLPASLTDESAPPPPAAPALAAAVETMFGELMKGSGQRVAHDAINRHVATLASQTAGYRTTLRQVLARHASTECGAAPDAAEGSSSGSAATAVDTSASAATAMAGGAASCSSMECSSDSDCDAAASRRPGPAWQPHCAGRVQSCALRVATGNVGGDAGGGCARMRAWRVPFASQCEHHMLPFYGTVHVVADESAALSAALLRDVVDLYSCRFQIQERITHQVADAVAVVVPESDVMVVCDSAHMCMVARGVEKHASSTMTSASRGSIQQDKGLQNRVLQSLLCAQDGVDCGVRQQ